MADPKEKVLANLERLNELAPDARERVENALKTTIEAELAHAEGPMKAGKEFSKGVFFSRQQGRTAAPDDDIIRHAVNLEEPKFKEFAERLATLKKLKDTGGGT